MKVDKNLGAGFLVDSQLFGAYEALAQIIDAGVSLETVKEINKRVLELRKAKPGHVVHSAFAMVEE